MKVGLFGFGKTGKAVATVLLQSHEVDLCWVIRKTTNLQHRSVPEFLGVKDNTQGVIFSKDEYTPEELFEKHPVDAIIDFSSADAVLNYGEEATKRGICIVTAISAYPETTIEHLKKLSEKTRILWSPNITIGINFLMLAAKILKTIAPYTDIELIEEHFKDKKEVSGTAIKISHTLGLSYKDIKSVRAGGIIGRHELIFGFPYQTVRLIHEAIAREAFGNGALFAVKNIINQKNGFYCMEDILIPYFNLQITPTENSSPNP
ncbi:MAG: dihydrodipicolinate reductase [Nitrososphaerota archaeon]|jgi:4-hydroxy-tetrahydrodipicolinate reductase|uniref:4-hydroxy-tetrahydrodipicolinate reductase n=1 Tax=Candidatus Bathycorpusculum sp. TaxID=2994959 RepID=UPI00282758AA|nr:dihydrodipicolinate reductase [Candidatus Termiticorpusculum sp.]MCL2257897.1 dihydrodipicolinate reductase [Candidatus Termiticorpusculum sp.]MCL2291964.1 dihydrodipicolinate reductase [Candidatus Termiticorpusculum sp.]MDR0460463.1 dihydrodipicolinate reductase [Nitrososphaerota archaeon]